MFKAGIMSMQRIANYGSFLQAYGLKSMLENLGCDVQFVDYHPGEVLAPPERRTTGGVKFRKVIEIIQMKAPWRHKIQYLKYKKNYAANYYPYLGISDEKNYAPDLDLLIIGSDEVFNCLQSNPNVGFAPELFGEGQHAKTVITYAASFGNTTEEKLKQYGLEEKITPWLANFQAISVRDANSGIIIRSLTGKEPEYHLDPVLTYDFLNRCSGIPKEIPESNYMLLYGYSGRFTEGECAAIRAYARERRLQIFCLGGYRSAAIGLSTVRRLP